MRCLKRIRIAPARRIRQKLPLIGILASVRSRKRVTSLRTAKPGRNPRGPPGQILDPATGTGTFLAEVIKQIAPKVKNMASGMWSQYIEQELIPRLHGFE